MLRHISWTNQAVYFMLKAMLKTLFSIGLILAAIIVIAAVWQSLPSWQQLNLCYQELQAGFDSAGLRSKVNGWGQLQICEIEQGNILDLDACLHKITQNDVAKAVNSAIWNAQKSLIPGTKDSETYKQEHNAACGNYPSTLF